MTRTKAIVANAIVIAVSLVLLFAVLEVAARVYLWQFADDAAFQRYASLRQLEQRRSKQTDTTLKYAPHRYLGFYPAPDFREGPNRHNSLGYRGDEITVPKPSGEYRIVCIGGSTTYSPGARDYRKSYPARLETELRERGYNVTVVNAGAESWQTYESLINFHFRVLGLEPDLIIVYHGVNDILGRMIWPPEAYKSDNSGAKVPLVDNRFMPPIWEYSTLIRALLIRAGRVDPHAAIDRVYNPLADTYKGREWQDYVIAGRGDHPLFSKVSADDMLKANPPVPFRRNLESMTALAKHYGVEVVLATFAHSRQFEAYPWSSASEFQTAYAEMNEVIENVGNKLGVYVYDFAAAFPDEKTLYSDGVHLTDAGLELKAELFADYIAENGLVTGAGDNTAAPEAGGE